MANSSFIPTFITDMKRIITLVLIFSSSVLFGQVTDTSRSIFENSSVYRNYQEVYLSNLGQAKYHLISPFQSNNHDFMDLFPDSSNSPTFTDVFYVSGSGRENYVNVNHTQRLGKTLFGKARILKTSSEGIYLGTEAELSNFELGLKYSPTNKPYSFEADFKNFKRYSNLNGGVSDSSFFSLLDSSNGNLKTTFPNQFNSTLNSSNSLDLKILDVNFNHAYKFTSSKIDSNSFLQIRQKLAYHRNQRNTNLINSSDFFANYYEDSVTTTDSLRLERVSHRVQLELISGHSLFSFGFGQNYFEYASLAPFTVHLENLFYGEFLFNKDSIQFRSYGEFLMSDGGYESFEFRNEIAMKFSENFIFNSFQGKANILTDLPELYYNRYNSNHVRWNLTNKTNFITQLWVKVENTNKKYGASLNYETQNNAVFFDENAQPIQTKISYLALSLNKDFEFTKWFFLSTNVHIQDVLTTENIEVPNLLIHNSLYFKGRLIRKVLRFKAGFNVLYYSKFTPRNYNPALDEFTIQSTTKVGNYPIIDVFSEFYIKQNFSFFVSVTHVNSNVFTGFNLNSINSNWNVSEDFGKNYLAISQYPIQDRAFKFGIKWRLFD